MGRFLFINLSSHFVDFLFYLCADFPYSLTCRHEGFGQIHLPHDKKAIGFWSWQAFSGAAEEVEKRISFSSADEHTTTIAARPSSKRSSLPPPIVVLPVDEDIIIVEALTRLISAIQALPTQGKLGGERATNRGDADRGKAPMPSAFTTDYGPSNSFGESFITLDMCIEAIDQVLQDHRLIRELMKMVMLSAD